MLVSIWMGKTQRILAWLFLLTFSGLAHQSLLWSRLYSEHMTLLTIKATLLCLSVYSAPVRLLQPLMICATVSASRILHSVVDLVCHCPGAEGLLLSCHDQSLGVSSDVAFIEPLARLQLHLAFSRWLWTACIRLSANQYFRCWADPFLLSFCWCIVQLGLTWDRTHHAWSWASLFLCQFIKVYRRWVLDEWNSESVNCSHLVFAGELALQIHLIQFLHSEVALRHISLSLLPNDCKISRHLWPLIGQSAIGASIHWFLHQCLSEPYTWIYPRELQFCMPDRSFQVVLRHVIGQ